MSKSILRLRLLPLLLVVMLATAMTTSEGETRQLTEEELRAEDRRLQAFDFFDISVDVCDNRPDGQTGDGPQNLGRCDTSRFPTCPNNSQICYNRKPSRDFFVPETHQPVYYIQYDRVFCYPNSFGGCSSCTPGRYCAAESRCILDERNYDCPRWF